MISPCLLAPLLLCLASQPTSFVLPCAGYAKAVETRASFGAHVTAASSPFRGSWHLAEDVWLPAGTQVRAIADGIVRYSAFSPTWTDARGATHWNLGNVVVVEHEIDPPEQGAARICSFYVHLASDRRVEAGARVQRGDVLGRIGRGESEENGRYPAHLHFGVHLGPYLQVPPAFERELRQAARSKEGLRIGTEVLRGELELERSGTSDLLVRSRTEGKACVLSLLVGSTAPKDPPPDIALWCQGYGEEAVLAEWLRPSSFLAARGAK